MNKDRIKYLYNLELNKKYPNQIRLYKLKLLLNNCVLSGL